MNKSIVWMLKHQCRNANSRLDKENARDANGKREKSWSGRPSPGQTACASHGQIRQSSSTLFPCNSLSLSCSNLVRPTVAYSLPLPDDDDGVLVADTGLAAGARGGLEEGRPEAGAAALEPGAADAVEDALLGAARPLDLRADVLAAGDRRGNRRRDRGVDGRVGGPGRGGLSRGSGGGRGQGGDGDEDAAGTGGEMSAQISDGERRRSSYRVVGVGSAGMARAVVVGS